MFRRSGSRAAPVFRPLSARHFRAFGGASYDPQKIEQKWQDAWKRDRVNDFDVNKNENKSYVLSQFPYPSGTLHMGHVRVYTISDCLARKERMQGKNVLHPMGWDAFGLPAENAAIERNLDPGDWTKRNISMMKEQLDRLGFALNWNVELSTCEPDYYKWTQWLFQEMFRAGLAYRKEALVNWDPVDQTVLANEQVSADGRSWRSGAVVEQRYLKQWFLGITQYADRLIDDLDELSGWPEPVKEMQRNWIGRSPGAEIDFRVSSKAHNVLTAFTTKPETIFGVTFLCVAHDHPVVAHSRVNNNRLLEDVQAEHPITKNPLPVYVADHVVSGYGTSVVMGVPAHDNRDYDFAVSRSLPIIRVLSDNDTENLHDSASPIGLLNSGRFNGMVQEEAREAMISELTNTGLGRRTNHYRLKDWLISRQRYWGAPIPVAYELDNTEPQLISPGELPVLLPQGIPIERKGGSPLARQEKWMEYVSTQGKMMRRETDTMDTFVDSSWYFLRYPRDPKLDSSAPFDPHLNDWMPVDFYVGGIEHAILHLLYSRFVTKFLYDQGYVKHKEPFKNLITQGMVHGLTYKTANGEYLKPQDIVTKDDGRNLHAMTGEQLHPVWEKMSKSKYNGVDPEAMIAEYGADTCRLFMLFKAPPEKVLEWKPSAVQGMQRWLSRVWRLASSAAEEPISTADKANMEIEGQARQCIEQVTRLVDNCQFNVAIAKMMEFSNSLQTHHKEFGTTAPFVKGIRALVLLMAPMAPHFASEIWGNLRHVGCDIDSSLHQFRNCDVHQHPWPSMEFFREIEGQSEATVVIQIRGRKRGNILVPRSSLSDDDKLRSLVLESPIFEKHVGDATKIKKTIIAPNRKLINLVI